jgi:hypothetical protein
MQPLDALKEVPQIDYFASQSYTTNFSSRMESGAKPEVTLLELAVLGSRRWPKIRVFYLLSRDSGEKMEFCYPFFLLWSGL